MTVEAVLWQGCDDALDLTTIAAAVAGEVWQLADGRAGVIPIGVDAARPIGALTEGIFKMQKTTTMVLLDGGRAYWDASASKVHYKKVGDRDFYLGRVVGDAASADTTCYVNLNVNVPADIELSRDAFLSVPVGTAAAGGFGFPRILGGAQGFYLTATSEAQKVDALGVESFATVANAIVEMAVRFPVGGSGSASDYSVGIASGTSATDADAIAQHLFLHTDGNSAVLSLQSKDGTTTVAATSTTLSYTAGSALANRVEVWMDMRNPADVQCYVNGVLVLASTVFDVSAYAGPWFLLAHAEKTTGTETGDMVVDWLRARFAEQG